MRGVCGRGAIGRRNQSRVAIVPFGGGEFGEFVVLIEGEGETQHVGTGKTGEGEPEVFADTDDDETDHHQQRHDDGAGDLELLKTEHGLAADHEQGDEDGAADDDPGGKFKAEFGDSQEDGDESSTGRGGGRHADKELGVHGLGSGTEVDGRGGGGGEAGQPQSRAEGKEHGSKQTEPILIFEHPLVQDDGWCNTEAEEV